jgi:hypothetical protein
MNQSVLVSILLCKDTSLLPLQRVAAPRQQVEAGRLLKGHAVGGGWLLLQAKCIDAE